MEMVGFTMLAAAALLVGVGVGVLGQWLFGKKHTEVIIEQVKVHTEVPSPITLIHNENHEWGSALEYYSLDAVFPGDKAPTRYMFTKRDLAVARNRYLKNTDERQPSKPGV